MEIVEVGELIRMEREKLGWSKYKLAQMADVSPSAITLLEKGSREGGVGTIARITAALGIPSDVVLRAALGKPVEKSPEDQPYVLVQVDDILRRLKILEQRGMSPGAEPSVRRYVAAQRIAAHALR